MRKLPFAALVLALGAIASSLQRLLTGPRHEFANIAEGTSETGNRTYLADASHSTRHLVVKIGSDANHVALCGTGDIALGVTDDQPDAAEDHINVQLLGAKRGTVLMTASAAITAGDMVVAAASGKIRTLTGLGSGTYYILGRAVEAAGADGDVIQVVPTFPIQRVV